MMATWLSFFKAEDIVYLKWAFLYESLHTLLQNGFAPCSPKMFFSAIISFPDCILLKPAWITQAAFSLTLLDIILSSFWGGISDIASLDDEITARERLMRKSVLLMSFIPYSYTVGFKGHFDFSEFWLYHSIRNPNASKWEIQLWYRRSLVFIVW